MVKIDDRATALMGINWGHTKKHETDGNCPRFSMPVSFLTIRDVVQPAG
jgi:hypothetical protein